ncbi:hypothetical protein [Nakamurella lactea]|uniref:hypothetical protein n=1 Tax=Nakamurella lactea TaxID=459515 RepID=UPI00040A8D7F|nr:hypothetical protein [Nakamurella lactea]
MRRQLAVLIAGGALVLTGVGVAAAAGTSAAPECAGPTDPSSLAQVQAWEACRFDALQAAVSKPPVTVDHTTTETTTEVSVVTGAPTTVDRTVTQTVPTTVMQTVTARTTVRTTIPGPTVTVTESGGVTAPETSTPEPTSEAPTTSTTTPTSSDPVPAGDCVGAANTPGGADPWGGCWPGAQNTGYPHGLPGDTRAPVTLKAYTGPTTIRSCGVVIDSKIVPQDLLIEAGNGTNLDKPCVTIKNSLVKGVIFAEQSNYGPVLISDTEVVPDGLSWWENIGRSNFRAIRVNSHGSQGVIKCDQNCEAIDSWVHGMEVGKSYHYNAFGGNGTNGFLIKHNYGTCGDWSSTEAGLTGDAGCSAVIGFYGDFAQNQNITITRNHLASTFAGDQDRQAGYCINPGYYPGKPYPDTKNISVTDNVFGRGGSGKCGVFGPSNSLNGVGKPNGNVWSDNRYDDGTPIARVEE